MSAASHRRSRRKPAAHTAESKTPSSAPSPDARIIATSQQSRFHTETMVTLSRDVDIHDLAIQYSGCLPLLVSAHLKLDIGVHYGLVGRNGTGKSTLLKAIAYGAIAALPANIRILYIEQISDDLVSDLTVLDEVYASDRYMCKLMAERDELQTALDSESLDTVVGTMHALHLRDLEDELAVADAKATARSGKRGWEARQALIQAELRLASAKNTGVEPGTVTDAPVDDAPPAVSSKDAMQRAQHRLADVCTRISAAGGDSREARAIKILETMGFADGKTHKPSSKVAQLSGGWKMRVALAKALFLEPDILLLDEPTNHLDLPAIIWLRKYIKSLDEMTIVTISHDRNFLDYVTDEIIVLKDRTLKYHVGNYEEYVVNTNNKQLMKRRMISAQEKQKEHVQSTIANAMKRGDTSLVATRKKKMERFGLQKSESGHRFKLNRDMVGYFTTQRAEIELETVEPPARIALDPPTPLRHKGTSLVAVEMATAGYKRGSPDILTGVTLNLNLGDRIVVLGSNGSGKSTLMDVIVGKLEVRSGRVQRHPNVRIGYFAQRHVDALSQHTETAVEYLTAEFSVTAQNAKSVDEIREMRPQECYERFGRVGLPISVAAGQPLETLSGGERTRVVLAYALYGAPQLLVLDEITNHLDMETIEALLDALDEWEGALVVVTHNEYFAQEVMSGRRKRGGRTKGVGKGDDGDECGSDDDDDDDDGAPSDSGIGGVRRMYHLRGGRLEELGGGIEEYTRMIEQGRRRKSLR